MAVAGQPLPTLAMDLSLGDVAPGTSRQVTWRLHANQPGTFVGFSSDYRALNYQGQALAPSLRAINTVFAPPEDLAFNGCNANPGPYSISGYVVNEDGESIEGAIVSAGTGVTGTTDSTGFYTLSNLGDGAYVLTLLNIGSTLGNGGSGGSAMILSGASGVVSADSNRFCAFKGMGLSAPILGPLNVGQGTSHNVPLPPFQASLKPPCTENTPECTQTWLEYLIQLWPTPLGQHIVVSGQSQTAADTLVVLPPITTTPQTGFKGAMWLKFLSKEDSQQKRRDEGTNYRELNVGWNLEQTKDLGAAYNRDLNIRRVEEEVGGYQGLVEKIKLFKSEENVYTIVRLDTPPPADPPVPISSAGSPYYDNHNFGKVCADTNVQRWMDDLDLEYTFVKNHVGMDSNPIPIFILGNEPNHAQDEWNYTGAEYAHLFNCYYKRWKGLETGHTAKPEALYAAGPGQRGPCEIEVVKDDVGQPKFYESNLGGGVQYQMVKQPNGNDTNSSPFA
jgi:hypothetical protein